jgi:cell wall-associated NlpC family hydrolase
VILEDLKYEHLLDRPFSWGSSDCLSLFRDFYRDNFGINITNYARPSDWSSDQLDLMRLCYEREGFELISDWKLKDLRPADVLCMAIGERNANHFAINLGNDQLVHHLYGRRSTLETFRGFYRNSICYILRHPDVPDLTPVYPDVDIRTLLDARNALQPQ